MQNANDRGRNKQPAKRCSPPPRFAGEMLSVVSDIMYVENLESVLHKIVTTMAELFSIRGLFISVLDENEQVFRIKAVYGYDESRQARMKKVTYSQERLKKDLDEKYKVAENVYFIRPGPEDYVKEDEPFYFHPENITKPRRNPDEWHELDYLKLVFRNRDNQVNGYIEIEEPVSLKVYDSETLEAMQVFANLAGIVIENAKMYQREVEESQRRRFLSDMIAHDINNYNQAVTSYIQMAMAGKDLPEKTAQYLERASASAWNISELIQRANMLNKIEEEGGRNLGPVELGEALKESISEVLMRFPDREVKIDLKLNNHRYFVTANEFIEEIFSNLLANAVEYDPHDKVRVEVSIGEFFVDFRRYWCVSIADNGIGIPDSKKNVIFGKFIKGDAGPHSIGLGLSIVQAIVKAYHGLVWVEDRVPGEHSKGSVFRVALPMSSSK